MLTRQQYVEAAESTITAIRSMLEHGSNHISDRDKVDFQYGNAIRAAVPILALSNALHGINPSHHVFAKLYLLAIKKYGYGQCGEIAQASIMHLIEKNIFPIDLCNTTEGGHSLIILGRKTDSNPSDISTWGDCAIICDPWANKVYPVSDFIKTQSECVTSSYNPEIYRVLGSPVPPIYLSGELAIQYSLQSKRQVEEFKESAMIHPSLITLFEKKIVCDIDLKEDLNKMELMLAALNNSFLGSNPAAIPHLESARNCLSSLKIGLDERKLDNDNRAAKSRLF